MDRTGQCMCGAIKFTAKDTPDTFSTCYCETCQRWSGGPMRGITVKTENLDLSGQEHLGVIQTSDFAERAFCKKCGSGIWFRRTSGKYFGGTSLPIGLLDDRSGLTVSYELFTDYKDATNEIPEGTQQMTKTEVDAIIATFDDEPDV